MNIPPSASYRVQFTPRFTFAECEKILPYLKQLGISHLYASPIFRARPGSTHGYDVCDHNVINPELGGEQKALRLMRRAQTLELGWIQDIVPNHMAVSGQNPLFMDVLENGPSSRFFPFFDIDWNHPDKGLNGRVLAPFLGDFLGQILQRGEIKLGYGENGFSIQYYDFCFPVRPDSYVTLLTHSLTSLREQMGMDHPDLIKLQGILYAIKQLPEEPSQDRYDQIFFIKRLLFELTQSSDILGNYITTILEKYNNTDEQKGSVLLADLLSEQYYRLAFWKVASEEINFRRFFSINDLMSLRVELRPVFDHIHQLVVDLTRKELITGLRIDHIDGLYDPLQYLRRLKESTKIPYLVVEKILGPEEPLPGQWPVQGTTGYEFMNMVCGLFVQQDAENVFSRIYQRFYGAKTAFVELLARKKRLIIDRHMSGDVDNLTRLIKEISSSDLRSSDITTNSLRLAIIEVLAYFPVYRTYISSDHTRPEERVFIETSLDKARRKNPDLSLELDFLERFLLMAFANEPPTEEAVSWLQFAMRFQQVTGPLMAKGLEDTSLYVMNRLLCLNEVGGWPERFGISDGQWWEFVSDRQRNWPAAMNATATHDTKRGEDSRTRLAVLSEIPEEWNDFLKSVTKLNSRRKSKVGKIMAPDKNDEYFLYQTLLASWPDHEGDIQSYKDRLEEYLIKAVREAKVHTGWLRPHEDYEQAYLRFASSLLKKDNGFFHHFAPLFKKVDTLGRLYSLGQSLIKITAPGIPDFYQGSEGWDFSFVDPDNRRPVDYAHRMDLLEKQQSRFSKDPVRFVQHLLAKPEEDGLKLFCIHRALLARSAAPMHYQHGTCEPLAFEGTHAGKLFGFVRRYGEHLSLSIVPRYCASFHLEEGFPLAGIWEDTAVLLPEEGRSTPLKNAFTSIGYPPGSRLAIRDVFADFPVALLVK